MVQGSSQNTGTSREELDMITSIQAVLYAAPFPDLLAGDFYSIISQPKTR